VNRRDRNSAVAAELEKHAERADDLARSIATTREPLRFAAGLLRVQAAVAETLGGERATSAFSGTFASDVDRVLPALRDVVRFAAEHGPPVLHEAARERLSEKDELARTRLELYWRGDRRTSDDYLSRAMLRPYVELLRDRSASPDRERARGCCPFCGGAPLVACRRSDSDSDGAARSLVCGLCALEWSFQRIQCPACFEESPARLPSYASESHASVRVEACETCRRYVKSIDLKTEPRAVPEVDDLASLSLDLWAIEQGFTRIEPGLAGM
jgi:FdhE protein